MSTEENFAKKLEAEELAKIIERHGRWLRGEVGGERANLADADLTGANLTGANLTGASRLGLAETPER